MGFNFGFFGSQEHRVFDYKPRYYDREKEALKEKFGHVDGRKEKEPYTPGSHLQGSFRSGHYQKSKKMNRTQSIIGAVGLILFFVVLLYIAKFYSVL